MSGYDEIFASELLQINKNTKRIADALEKANKLFIDFMAFRKAENIVRELKEEDLKVDTKVYDGLKVVEEVRTKESKKEEMQIKILYNYTYESGKAYNVKWIGHKGDIALPKSVVDAMNKDFKEDTENIQMIRVPTSLMEDKG